MDEQEIVKLFLNHGFQLSQNTLPIIEKDPEKFLSDVEKIEPRPFIVTKEHLEKITETKKEEKLPKVELLEQFSFEKKELRVEDYVKHFTKIYEKIREILLKNTRLTKLVSVNKITDNTKEFSLIASVREKGMNNLLIEDPTGEIHVFFEEDMKKKFDDVQADDIIGLICERKEDKIYVKDVIYPDVSVTREINKTAREIKSLYIYKPSLLDDKEREKLIDELRQTKKTDPVFVYGDWEDREVIKEFDNVFLISGEPSLFEIDKVKVLTLPEIDNSENTLNKRLIKGGSLLDVFVVEEVPDIILSSEKETYHKNYKGTTIVSNRDKNRYFVLNLKTREVEEKKI